ncbi:DUF1877 family protein [Streptomyces sp. NPDC057137]|uniref:DUF1877 family protein n=1 Tax=Streptomyces sp. NPDC057137 TaxID=3346030 RepID=UPI00363BBA58
MTLSRHDAAQVAALLRHPDGERAGRLRLWEAWDEGAGGSPALEFVEESHGIARNWDGMHVLLTGCVNHTDEDHEVPCGPVPARDVVLGGLPLMSKGQDDLEDSALRLGNARLLLPAEVRAAERFLRSFAARDTDIAARIRERAALIEAADVYSFRMLVGSPDGRATRMSMIEDGSLAESLRVVRDFYARAAAAGNAVVKEIS